MEEIKQNIRNQNKFSDFEFLNNTKKETIRSMQLYEEYNDGLDSINLVTTIETLKLKVEYLLSQDTKYQKVQNKTLNKDNQDSNKQLLNVASQRPNLNLMNNFELPQFTPHLELSQQQFISPLEVVNVSNSRSIKYKEEGKEGTLIMKKRGDRKIFYSSPYDYS